MEREVYISELLELLRLAGIAQIIDPLHKVSLYNPTRDEEYFPIEINAGFANFQDALGKQRSIPLAAISQWTAIIAPGSALISRGIVDLTGEAKRQSIIKKFNALGLMSSDVHSITDLQSILEAWETPLNSTDPEIRKRVYQAIKKAESDPKLTTRAFQLGYVIMERWLQLLLDPWCRCSGI